MGFSPYQRPVVRLPAETVARNRYSGAAGHVNRLRIWRLFSQVLGGADLVIVTSGSSASCPANVGNNSGANLRSATDLVRLFLAHPVNPSELKNAEIFMRQMYERAVQCHQAGNLEQAEQLYRQILQSDPHQPDTLHLLGVLHFQRGSHDAAREYITRALQDKPDFAEAISNLGNVLKAQGKLDEAVERFGQALRLNPGLAGAHTSLAAVLHKQGKLDEAAASLRQALRLNPAHAAAHNNLGAILLKQGKLDEAVVSFHQALRVKPTDADAHINLGHALLGQGKLEEAVRSYQQALRVKPHDLLAHYNLGRALRQQNKLEEAANVLRQALRLQPQNAEARCNLACILVEQGNAAQLDEAVAHLREAVRLNPTYTDAHNNLGIALHRQGKLEEAFSSYQQALRLEPDSFVCLYNLGHTLREQGKVEEAANTFQQALRIKPEFAEAHVCIGQIHEELGELAEAEACYRQSLRLQPSLLLGHARLAGLLRKKLTAADLQALRERLADPRLTVPERIQLLFPLARVLDEKDDFAGAADCLRHANAARRVLAEAQQRAHDPEKERDFVDAVLRQYGPDFFACMAGAGLETELPVFVFGLPRSGTTLVEQILASHSRVYAAGELELAQQSYEAIPVIPSHDRQEAVGQHVRPLPDGRGSDQLSARLTPLPRLDASAVRRLAERHLGGLTALLQRRISEAPVDRIVDKMPGNYMFLGLIAAMFPRAVLIHCRRDLRDVAVSCWMQDFDGTKWSNDIQHIAAHFRQYRRLMDHWRGVLPMAIHDVQYEELVDDLEGGARRLVSACRLDWEPACLEFYRTRREVRTASMLQVRQPIYKKSVGRWRNYETLLADLLELVTTDQ